MSAPLQIPRTSLQAVYKKICKMSYAQRLRHADLFLAEPSLLVDEIDQAVETFSAYDYSEPFYSNPKRAPKKPADVRELRKGHNVAWHLREQKTLNVRDEPDLNARYIDYEIAPARTKGNAKFTDGGSWRSGIFVDLLLANQNDGTPIVGEVKIRTDKEPFTALIQALTGAVHLVTQRQYGRLLSIFPEAQFPTGGTPRVDCYVLLHRFLNVHQDGLKILDQKANALSELLINHPGVSTFVRRIACVELEFGVDGALIAEKRWAHYSPDTRAPMHVVISS